MWCGVVRCVMLLYVALCGGVSCCDLSGCGVAWRVRGILLVCTVLLCAVLSHVLIV